MTLPSDFRDRLQAEAQRLGFDGLGIAPAVAPPGYDAYRRWLELDRDAGMNYLRAQAGARAHPGSILDGVRSVIAVAMVYGERSTASPNTDPHRVQVARYARGEDYHKLIWKRLESLLAWIQRESPGTRGRAVCDTAPLLERDFARLAGLGWIGKNTMMLSRSLGSFTLLGALLVDVELPYDPPFETDHCGNCTRCLDACPTAAFPEPYQLDASLCLSYWTIEHRGPIPESIAERLNGWVFGCDICQDVCPWNRKAPSGREPGLATRPGLDEPDLIAWLSSDPEEFSALLRGSALKRAKRAGLLRNAAMVLGAQRRRDAVPALILGLADDDPTVRASCGWALKKIGTPEAVEALRNAPTPAMREALHRGPGGRRVEEGRVDQDDSDAAGTGSVT